MSGHSAAEMAHEERRYLQVFAWLAILTAAEIGITYAPIARVAVVLLLVILAATKASDYRFRDLIEQVVLSETFRSK